MASRRSRRHRRFDVGSSRQRRDSAVAQGRERRGHIGEARRGERIADAGIFCQEGAVEAVARAGRVDRLDRVRIDPFAFLGVAASAPPRPIFTTTTRAPRSR